MSNWYTQHVLAAAESDPLVTEAFFRVMNLIDPPSRLLHPSIVGRVVRGAPRRLRAVRATPAATPVAAGT